MTTSDYFGSCYPHEGAAHFRLRLTFRPLSCRALSLRLLPVISARAKQTFGFDLRSLAVMRIGLGGVLAADLLQRSIALKAHYTDEGVLPRALMQGLANPGIGLYRLFGGVGPVIALACVSLLAALALTVGFHTRVACIASWVLLVSLQNRNPFVYHSGDDLLRLALFWGMFLPLGARFSLDAGRDPAPPSGRGNQIISVGTLGLFWQLVCLYLFLFDHKMMGTSWRNGTAVYDALSVEQYRTSFGSALLGFPTLLPLFTHAILVQQALTVVLLVSPILIGPLRLFAVLGVIATQLGFGPERSSAGREARSLLKRRCWRGLRSLCAWTRDGRCFRRIPRPRTGGSSSRERSSMGLGSTCFPIWSAPGSVRIPQIARRPEASDGKNQL